MADEKTEVETKNKNWFAKHKVLTGVFAFILFVILVGAVGGTKAPTSNTNTGTPAPAPATTPTPAPAPAPQTKKFNINDIYAKIETGMTEDQVKAIVTKDPINCTESEMQGIGVYKMCTYGNVFLDAGSILVQYTNGKVSTKTKSQY